MMTQRGEMGVGGKEGHERGDICDGSESKESACNEGDPGLIPGLERSPGEGNGSPLQYSFLENSMDRRAWWVTAQGVTRSQIQLNNEHTAQNMFIEYL